MNSFCRLCVLLLLLAGAGSAFASGPALAKIHSEHSSAAARPLRINIFGDGNPLNGIEDDRIDMSSPAWNAVSRKTWNMGAGTVHCDGKNRGTALILDPRFHGGPAKGLVLATSAHVLFDLENDARFLHCRFHYMALDSLPGYQADIDLNRSLLGPFEPGKSRLDPDFGKNDWAFLYVPSPSPGISGNGRIRLGTYASVASSDPDSVRYQFIAFSRSSGSITISTRCQVRESTAGDLGGGAWRGQLLDDCDSEGGASGGGLIAETGGRHFLVAIRSGAHWDREAFPEQAYPGGPPDGSTWDVTRNTNFSRAIDGELIGALDQLIKRLDRQFKTARLQVAGGLHTVTE